MPNQLDPKASQSSDIVIIGGGLAGMSMAAALSSLPLNILIIEYAKSEIIDASKLAEQEQYSPSFDDRAIALSLASINILRNIGVLSVADIDSLTPIEKIHVSDKGHLGMLRMTAAEVGEADLGKVIPAPLLGEKLTHYIAHGDFAANIEIQDQSAVQSVQHHTDKVVLNVQQQDKPNQITASLAVLADGGRSGIAEQIGLPACSTDYQQVAILANVEVDKAHQNIAYERFTETGPLALLPLREQEFKLVWTVLPQEQEDHINCTDDEFLSALQQRFGFRAGQFCKVSRRAYYPMHSIERSQIVSGRVALIGNAAHSLHPIAGQGFNLGLRDVACLAEILAEQFFLQNDLGDAQALMNYQSQRELDIHRTAGFTDKLVTIFSTSFAPIALLRTAGLLALDLQPQLKRDLMRKLMGVAGQQFKLMTHGSLQPESVSQSEGAK